MTYLLGFVNVSLTVYVWKINKNKDCISVKQLFPTTTVHVSQEFLSV